MPLRVGQLGLNMRPFLTPIKSLMLSKVEQKYTTNQVRAVDLLSTPIRQSNGPSFDQFHSYLAFLVWLYMLELYFNCHYEAFRVFFLYFYPFLMSFKYICYSLIILKMR